MKNMAVLMLGLAIAAKTINDLKETGKETFTLDEINKSIMTAIESVGNMINEKDDQSDKPVVEKKDEQS